MPNAEIITIGTELLLGEIQDTNTRYLARSLRDAGIDLYRTMMVGDNINRIAQAILEAYNRTDIIITTGGLGPTVDDPTRQAVAQALGVKLEYRPELWEQIQARFQRYNRTPTENNKRQAYIPAGSQAIENPVGTAPSFVYAHERKVIISLPGVPREMEYLIQQAVIPYLQSFYQLKGTIKTCVIHTATMGESQVDELVGDLEITTNPTVGLLAHPGQVDIRVTAKAETTEEADQMIQSVVSVIRDRLQDAIFGMDEETLEAVALKGISARQWKLAIVESGLGGGLINRLSKPSAAKVEGEILADLTDPLELKERVRKFHQVRGADFTLGASLTPQNDKQVLALVMINPKGEEELVRSYGGPPQQAPAWAVNLCLDLIRKSI
ncbi:MAG TPA: CinA family nicotinamide mononucleotide deamidase-related protein [Anaerolineaceae bacterium]|jgi:nicotinamide-nucleotide amidase